MPPASHTSAARTARETKAQHARTRPKQVTQRLPISKIGWDRKFRLVMMLVFGLVGWIGLKAGLALVDARGQASQETSLVSSLQTQHRQLVAQEKALHQPATIMREARQLGMVRAGERSYVVVGLSNH
jgi:cell division protein FtsB